MEQTEQFKRISSVNEVMPAVADFLGSDSFDKNCWIIFDVDYTLTMPTMMYEGRNYPITQRSLISILSEIKDREILDRVCSSSVFLPQTLIEKQLPDALKNLNQRGARVFALTAALGAKKLRKHRFQTLNSLGVNFSDAFDFSEMDLDDIDPYIGYKLGYYNGVLYANGECDLTNNKGKVLKSFIKKIGQRPTHVVIVDDKKKNLENLQAAVTELGINYLGLLYTDSKEYEDLPSDILKQRIEEMQRNLLL
ncbi:MAG: DUF2608 domain-containing protein [Alphaproteobacteria bacterium]|nr:DUF2608 domain-containing protein [Alphaproteobacteria bacterium]